MIANLMKFLNGIMAKTDVTFNIQELHVIVKVKNANLSNIYNQVGSDDLFNMDCQKGYLKNEENCNLSRNFLWVEIEKRCEYHDN